MGCRDSISNLPDEILGKILSLVPIKVAASTSILSKRWRNLLGLVDTLCFDESMVVYPNEEEATIGSHRFLDFVDKTFALLSNSPIIKKLSLSHQPRRGCEDEHSRFKRWIWTAMERGLVELHLHATFGYCGMCLERDLLTSNTLVKLTLSGVYYLEVEGVFFSALKSLSLLTVLLLDYVNYCRLLDGCPVLEELFITDADHWYPPCCGAFVESASIKRLVVFVHLPDSQKDHSLMDFNAPSLVYLDYSSYVSEQYDIVYLELLVEARLSLRLWESTNDYDYSDDDDVDVDVDVGVDVPFNFNFNNLNVDADGNYFDDFGNYYVEVAYESKAVIFGDVTDLVSAISNITTLRLSPDSLEAFHFCCKSMPVFNNLLNLFIESDKVKGWQVMPLLLKSCPNLETLAIKGLLHRVTSKCGDACACIPKKQRKVVKEEVELCCLWTCQVKMLEISEYAGSFQELQQMRHFLGKLECLEIVKVGFDADKKNNSGDIAEEAYKELQNARQEALRKKKAEKRKMMDEAEAKLSKRKSKASEKGNAKS